MAASIIPLRRSTGVSYGKEFNHAAWLWSLRSTRTRQRTYVVDYAVTRLARRPAQHAREAALSLLPWDQVWWVAFLFTLYLGALKGRIKK